MKTAKTIAALLLAATCFGAQGQVLPKLQEFYFDADARTTQPIVAVKGEGQALVDKLAVMVDRNTDTIEADAQLAHLAILQGKTELADSLYGRAATRATRGGAQWRTVLWNRGWDYYRTGRTKEALADWSSLANSFKPGADWLPPTMAIALWSEGRKDDAIEWYAAAVRTEPAQWSEAARYAELLPGWRPVDHATLAEVQKAWAAKPPAWRAAAP